MMADLKKQAQRFGTDVRPGYIVKADLSQRPFRCVDDHDNVIEADTVIIATGASARWLGLDSEQKLYGQGVSACATCDGYFYKGLDVAVVGGGDTACEEANYLATLCNKVYLIHRRNELRASKSMQHRVLTNPKIEMIWDSTTKEICGNDLDGVTGADLQNVKTGEIRHIDIAGFFVAIGHKPNTDFVKGTPAARRTSPESSPLAMCATPTIGKPSWLRAKAALPPWMWSVSCKAKIDCLCAPFQGHNTLFPLLCLHHRMGAGGY